MKISSSPFHEPLINPCNHKGMLMMRRVLIMAAVLVIPVLLAVAGSLLAAPAGPPSVDSRPVRLAAGPDGAPAPGLEPVSPPAAPQEPVPAPQEAPPATAPVEPAPLPPAPAPAVPPAPVVPPVIIDGDDGISDGAADDGEG